MAARIATFRVMMCGVRIKCGSRLTKKAEPPPTRDVNRDSGTDSANGGWLRRLVRHHVYLSRKHNKKQSPTSKLRQRHKSKTEPARLEQKHNPGHSDRLESVRHELPRK